MSQLALLGGSLAAVLMLALAARLLGLGGGAIADEAAAMREAEDAISGFEAVSARVGSDRRAAIVQGRDGSVALLKQHGAHVAARHLPRLDAEARGADLRVETGDARFGPVLVKGVSG